MAKVSSEKYANVAFGTVTMSAANTLTFAQILFGVGLFEGKALVVHRVGFYPSVATEREVVTAADSYIMALTTSNRLTALDLSEPAVVIWKRRVGIGVAVESVNQPHEIDFTQLPGGGKLLPANPIFIGMTSLGFAAAGSMTVRIEFTFVELSPQDYLEVIQSMFPANVV